VAKKINVNRMSPRVTASTPLPNKYGEKVPIICAINISRVTIEKYLTNGLNRTTVLLKKLCLFCILKNS